VDILYVIVLAVSGFVIGFVGGMVGLVLGVVRYPIVLNVEPSLSLTAGTNLGVSTLGAITATIRHYRQGNIRYRPFIILAATGATGAFIGSFLTGFIPAALLLMVIGTIVSCESFLLLKASRLKDEHQISRIADRKKKSTVSNAIFTRKRLIILESSIGLGVGVLGGVVGLVLGSIRMPAMITIIKMEPRAAVGTNLAAASVMGISGSLGHFVNNNIDYFVLIAMGSGAMIGGYLGARYTNRFKESNLKRLIGLVLVIVAFTMFLRVFQLGTGY
jgi:uncharacterized protein